jgi:uncharacterized protein
MSTLFSTFSVSDHGLRLAIKAKPATKGTRDARVVDIGDGKRAIEIRVAAAAIDGKANKALIDLLAKRLDVKKTALSVRTGQTARLKVIDVQGDSDALIQRLSTWLGES